MLVERLIKETVEIQGFCLQEVRKTGDSLEALLKPDKRFSIRCSKCGQVAKYRETTPQRRFRHVPLWGLNVIFLYSPRRVKCQSCGEIHVEAMPYADVVKERAPQATLVFDKFYIIQHLSKAVDLVRIQEIREKGKGHKQLVAKSRYIWLKKTIQSDAKTTPAIIRLGKDESENSSCLFAERSLQRVLGNSANNRCKTLS